MMLIIKRQSERRQRKKVAIKMQVQRVRERVEPVSVITTEAVEKRTAAADTATTATVTDTTTIAMATATTMLSTTINFFWIFVKTKAWEIKSALIVLEGTRNGHLGH